MSDGSTSSSPRVVKVAAGLESTDRHVPARDMRHEALDVLTGGRVSPSCAEGGRV